MSCSRHPAEPVTGICTSCLRDRLAAATFNNSGHRPIGRTSSFSNASPELRRSKSCSVRNSQASSGYSEPRRMSCDVTIRNSLRHLFNIEDEKIGRVKGVCEVESKKLGFSRVKDPEEEIRGKLMVSNDLIGSSGVEEELKTMKEQIDLELKEIGGSFWAKLRKWKVNQKNAKKKKLIGENLRETQSKVHESNRISLDEKEEHHSASLDPQFMVKKFNDKLSSIEDQMSSTIGGSGSVHTKDYCSDSSSSQRQSLDVEIFHGTKLIITDNEFRKLNLNSNSVPIGGNPKGVIKKSSRWKRVFDIWGSIHGLSENGFEDGSSPRLIRSSSCVGSGSAYTSFDPYSNMRSVTAIGGFVKKSRESFVKDHHRSFRYSPSNSDNNSLMWFYLTPLRSYRSKSSKHRLHNSLTRRCS